MLAAALALRLKAVLLRLGNRLLSSPPILRDAGFAQLFAIETLIMRG